MKEDREHIRRMILDHYRAGHTQAEAHQGMAELLGPNAPSHFMVSKWYHRFEEEGESIADHARSGRPQTIDRAPVLSALASQPEATVRMLEHTTGVNYRTVDRILNEAGKTPKKPQVVPHVLTEAEKKKRVEVCMSNLALPHPRTFLHSMIAQDEKYVYFSNPATTHVWVDYDAPAPPRARRDPHCRKVLLSFWFSFHGVVYWHILPEGTMATSETISEELDEVIHQFAVLAPGAPKITLLWDNARPHKSHVTQIKLDSLGVEMLAHPPYSPDISPCDYHSFRSFEHFCSRKHFTNRKEVEDAVAEWIASRPTDFWRRGIEALRTRWERVVASHGEYLIDD